MRLFLSGLIVALLACGAVIAKDVKKDQGKDEEPKKKEEKSDAKALDVLAGQWTLSISPDFNARKKRALPITDQVTFRDSAVDSQWFKENGFVITEYVAKNRHKGEEAAITLSAESDKQGSIRWEATTKDGKTMNGAVAWTKGDEKALLFHLRGTKR
jgi:hypothetical protein